MLGETGRGGGGHGAAASWDLYAVGEGGWALPGPLG